MSNCFVSARCFLFHQVSSTAASNWRKFAVSPCDGHHFRICFVRISLNGLVTMKDRLTKQKMIVSWSPASMVYSLRKLCCFEKGLSHVTSWLTYRWQEELRGEKKKLTRGFTITSLEGNREKRRHFRRVRCNLYARRFVLICDVKHCCWNSNCLGRDATESTRRNQILLFPSRKLATRPLPALNPV